MKFDPPVRLHELAQWLDCPFVGPPDHPVTGMNEIHRVEAGDLTFCDVEKYYARALNSAAGTVLINKNVEAPEGKALLVSGDPFGDFNRLGRRFRPQDSLANSSNAPRLGRNVQIGRNVVMGHHVSLEDDVQIGHNVVLGDHVSIGAGSLVHPQVTLYSNTHVGQRCVIHANTVIGADAFYFKKRPDHREKLYSCGGVRIEDDVEIGSNCSIDRGVTHWTIIGRGTKLDNLIQIGHDVHIGEMCLIAAQAGIAGAVRIGHGVHIWAQVGITQGVSIGDGAVLLARSGVMTDLPGHQTYLGAPCQPHRQELRSMAAYKLLPHLLPGLRQSGPGSGPVPVNGGPDSDPQSE